RVRIDGGKPGVVPKGKPSVEQVRQTIIVRRWSPAQREHRFVDDFDPFRSRVDPARRSPLIFSPDGVLIWPGSDPLERVGRHPVTLWDGSVHINSRDDVSFPGIVDRKMAIGIAGSNDGVPFVIPGRGLMDWDVNGMLFDPFGETAGL